MSQITLNLDKTAEENFKKLRRFYNASSNTDLILKALSLLTIASEIEMTHGKLIARKGANESQIVFR